jgi:hypothetical protein
LAEKTARECASTIIARVIVSVVIVVSVVSVSVVSVVSRRRDVIAVVVLERIDVKSIDQNQSTRDRPIDRSMTTVDDGGGEDDDDDDDVLLVVSSSSSSSSHACVVLSRPRRPHTALTPPPSPAHGRRIGGTFVIHRPSIDRSVGRSP